MKWLVYLKMTFKILLYKNDYYPKITVCIQPLLQFNHCQHISQTLQPGHIYIYIYWSKLTYTLLSLWSTTLIFYIFTLDITRYGRSGITINPYIYKILINIIGITKVILLTTMDLNLWRVLRELGFVADNWC